MLEPCTGCFCVSFGLTFEKYIDFTKFTIFTYYIWKAKQDGLELEQFLDLPGDEESSSEDDRTSVDEAAALWRTAENEDDEAREDDP